MKIVHQELRTRKVGFARSWFRLALSGLLLAGVNLTAAPELTTITGGPSQGNPLFYGYVDGTTESVAQFHTPVGLALDVSGNLLYIADRDNNAVRTINFAAGLTYTFATFGINKPVGVALSSLGNVIVLNRGNGNNGTVLEFDSFGDFVRTNATGLTNANGLALDSLGNIYATVQSNRVIVIDLVGTVTTVTTVTNANTLLKGITLNSSGYLAVCDAGRNGVLLINPTTGSISNLTGFNGAGDKFGNKANAKFNQPYGITAAGGDVLVVADYGNHRVKVVGPSGTVTNLYGVSSNYWVLGPQSQGIFPGWWDGTVCAIDTFGCPEARLPAGVAFASNGDIYSTEDYYHLIRKVTTTGLPLPPPPPPPVPDPVIGWVDFPPPALRSRLITGSSFVFNNDVIVAIMGTAGSETHFTFGPTPVGVDTIPNPSPTVGSTPPAYRDDVFAVQVAPSIIPIQPDTTVKAISFQAGRSNSAIVSARFQFRTGSPLILGDNAASFIVTNATVGAEMWYTIDGTDPTNSGPSIAVVGNPANVSLNISSNTIFKIRAFRANYAPSEIVVQEFSTTNFNANKITFGFASGEASSEFVAAAGQNFFAPVTLTLLPQTKMYSLQFNITVSNSLPAGYTNAGPPITPGAVGFETTLLKPIPNTLPVIYERVPTAMYLPFQQDPPPVGQIFTYDGKPFLDLRFTNSLLNLLGIGWLERADKTNLYDTTKQDLVTFSQAHDTLFLSSAGKVVLGGYNFRIPADAANGQNYKIDIGRPSATLDGVGAPGGDLYIQAPTNGSLTVGAINSVKVVTVGQRRYIAGDAAPFRWYNAGDFGNSNLLSDDVMQIFQSAIYFANLPPAGSDFFDGMDSCCVSGVTNGLVIYQNGGTILPNNAARNPLFDGNDTAINFYPFGDGELEVSDVYVTFRRSLDPSLTWWQRYHTTNGLAAETAANSYGPGTSGSGGGSGGAMGGDGGSGERPSVQFIAGDAIATAGQTLQIPIVARIHGDYPLRVLMLGMTVSPLDGTTAVADQVTFTPASGLGSPTIAQSRHLGNYAAAWLNRSIAGFSNDVVLGTLTFKVPAGASADAAYAIAFDHASASPNGTASFKREAFTGLVTLRDRSGSSLNDGISDAWRLRHFGTLQNFLGAATADADGDHANNLAEYRAGTDPNDGGSILRLAGGKGPTPNFVVRWPSVSGKNYVIERSPTLFGGPWSPIATVAGTGWDMEFQDPMPAGANRFYRIKIAP